MMGKTHMMGKPHDG